jgi:hypothetical protein
VAQAHRGVKSKDHNILGYTSSVALAHSMPAPRENEISAVRST